MLVEAITWSNRNKITVVESDIQQTYKNFKEDVKTASTAEKDAILLLSFFVLESLVLLYQHYALLIAIPQRRRLHG